MRDRSESGTSQAVAAPVRVHPNGNVLDAARMLSAGVTAGFLGGLLFGGLGGRLAMLVLRLTSDPRLHGLTTDDGFTIGVVSAATLFLVVVTVVAGAIGGLVYLVVRSWFPERARPWVFGSLTAVVGGSIVIRPGGIDFTLLDPLWLAILMFIALPAAYGVVVSLLAERFLQRGSTFRRSRVWIAGLVALVPVPLLGTRGLLIALVVVVALVLGPRSPALASVWTSRVMTWIGRAVLAAAWVVAVVSLGRDVAQIL